MSTDYLTEKPIPFDQLRQELAQVGLEEHPPVEANNFETCLTDGCNCVWAFRTEKGHTAFTRFASNDPEGILAVLTDHFGTPFVSGHEDAFHDLVESDYRNDFITVELALE